MQDSQTKEALMPKPSQTPYYISLILLLGVLSGSLFLLLQNVLLEDDISTSKENINSINQKIQVISQDRGVIISKILRSNSIRPSIDLEGIVAKFYDAAARANVILDGFSVSNDVITTNLTATTPDGNIHPDAVTTIIKMMRDYANAENSSFRLDPITSVSGDLKSRSTSIVLRLTSSSN